MKSKLFIVNVTALTLIIFGIIGFSATSFAADQDRDQVQDQDQDQDQTQIQSQSKTQQTTQAQDQSSRNEPVYGWELMSVKERQEHRAKMQKMKTQKERTAYLEQHHKQMEERAKERGVSLPDRPMMGNRQPGGGFGPGPGAGGGGGARSR